jgi:isocitrate lyase
VAEAARGLLYSGISSETERADGVAFPSFQVYFDWELCRVSEGYYQLRPGIDYCIQRGIAYAPYADLIWWETSEPDLGEAREFAQEMKARHPDRLLAYNCSPSFNWRAKLDESNIETFQEQIADMGYRFQFVTLAGFHALNLSMFELARGYS